MPRSKGTSTALLIVDVQVGSVSPSTEHIVQPLNGFLERHLARFSPVIAFRYVNSAESPTRRLLGEREMSRGPDTDLCDFVARLPVEVLTKNSYSAVTDALLHKLRCDGATQACLIGMDTDMCVLHTALDLFSACIRPIVLSDLCASTGGEAAHSAGLSVIRRSIGTDQVIESATLCDTAFPKPLHPQLEPAIAP